MKIIALKKGNFAKTRVGILPRSGWVRYGTVDTGGEGRGGGYRRRHHLRSYDPPIWSEARVCISMRGTNVLHIALV